MPPAPEDRFWRRLLQARLEQRWGNFSWTSLRTLVQSANDEAAKVSDASIVNRWRMRWVAAQRARGIDPHAPIRLPGARRLLLLGDPGEMDGSQYVLVRDLAATQADVLLLMSDVVYPAGHVDDWADAVHLPYLGLPEERWEAARPPVELPAWKVLAMPGNHDWYDGLTGFMFHACGAETLPEVAYARVGTTFRARLGRRLWKRPRTWKPERSIPLREQAAARQGVHAAPGPLPFQPAPYFAAELGGGEDGPPALTLLCVDTGIDGSVDVEQAEWLTRALRRHPGTPKLVALGKPVLVDDVLRAPRVDHGPRAGRDATPVSTVPATLTELLMQEGEDVIAWVAGDIHNAQRVALAPFTPLPADPDAPPRCRLDVTLPRRPGLPPLALISGGGGAYLHQTHSVPLGRGGALQIRSAVPGQPGIAVPRVAHTRFPSRAQSVGMFTQRVRLMPAAGLALACLALAAVVAVGLRVLPGNEEVRLGGAELGLPHVVGGGLLSAAGVVAVGVAVALLRGRRRWLAVVPALAGLLPYAGVHVNDAPLLAGTTVLALGLPVLVLLLMQLRAFPEVLQYLPVRTVAALVGGFGALRAARGSLADVDALVTLGIVVGAVTLAALVRRGVDAAQSDAERRAVRGDRRATQTVALVSLVVVSGVAAGAGVAAATWLGGPGDVIGLVGLADVAAVAAAFLVWVGLMAVRLGRLVPLGLVGITALGALAAGGLGAWAVPAGLPWAAGAGQATAFGLAGAGLVLVAGMVLGARELPEPAAVDAALDYRDLGGPPPPTSLSLAHAMAIAGIGPISSVAEAIEPPFAKSFTVVDLEDGVLRLTTYGVNDEAPDDDEPVAAGPLGPARGAFVVDEVTIALHR